MHPRVRKGLLLLSVVLLGTGGTILFGQLLPASANKADAGKDGDALSVRREQGSPADVQGHTPAQSVERYLFNQDGKDLFNLLIAEYPDQQGIRQRAVLFPNDNPSSAVTSSPTGLRHDIWQKAADVIVRKAPANALFLSWWDDGQRVHFLSGKDSWLRKPSAKTFVGPVWKALEPHLPAASDEERARLEQMARWLTMDSEKALGDIAAHFGTSRPVYLLVNNDLLLHLGEIAAYSGTPLSLNFEHVPVGHDLHGDIAQVKRWAHETGDGNYLAQKEGGYYRVWATSDAKTKNSLLVRLLPFVDSLKKLPEGVNLVYQSHWGGFLSIYEVNPAVHVSGS